MSTEFDGREFRKTLGTFTTGVTIITAISPSGEKVGVTANSFNSVSLDPPLVLWSLARSSRSLAVFEAAEHWAVHILADDQETLSTNFARGGQDKFASVATESGIGGVPLLTGCTSLLQCKTEYKYEGGDHVIFVGRVHDFRRSEKPPLVFMSGQYAVAAGKGDIRVSDADMTSGADISFNENALDYLLPRAHYQIYSRVRAYHQRHGLNDKQYFAMVSLMARDGLSRQQLNQTFNLTSHIITEHDLDELVARCLIGRADAEADAPLSLRPSGRELALQIIAESKAIEAEVLSHFDEREILLLKKLLKRLVQVSDIGLRSLWEGEDRD